MVYLEEKAIEAVRHVGFFLRWPNGELACELRAKAELGELHYFHLAKLEEIDLIGKVVFLHEGLSPDWSRWNSPAGLEYRSLLDASLAELA